MSVQPSHSELQRDVGRVEGTLGAMGDRLDKLEEAMDKGFDKVGAGLEKIDKRLAVIESREAESKGAWKVVVVVATAVSGVIAWAANFFLGG